MSWWQRAAVYQVYPRSFADSDGDGVGDVGGLRDRLGHLDELGVGALWLSPFYPSPMADFGYDVADYCDVDPAWRGHDWPGPPAVAVSHVAVCRRGGTGTSDSVSRRQ